MADFLYTAKDAKGIDHQGDIKSPDAHSVAATLRKKGLIVISIKQKNPPNFGFFSTLFERVSFEEIVILTRQLAIMISSGLVLSEAIDILEEQQTNKTLKKAFGEISADIKGGLTLAQALSRYPRIFPRLYVNLVKSGETSGRLDSVLAQMAEGLEKEREFRSKIKGAMIYPILVISMMAIVIVIMMIFVIPKLVGLYEQSTIELPLPTKILIFISNSFINFWWVAVLTLVLAYIFLRRWKKTPEGNIFLGKIILGFPLLGKVVTNVTLANFSRTFGLLTSAGIPLLESMGIVEDLTDNPVFKKVLKDAYTGVERGLPFSALLTSSVFPKIVPQMVRVGEETGKVDEVFFKLSEYFESESDHLLKNLTVAIEPIILIFLGIGVAFLVISILLPIYKLTTSF